MKNWRCIDTNNNWVKAMSKCGSTLVVVFWFYVGCWVRGCIYEKVRTLAIVRTKKNLLVFFYLCLTLSYLQMYGKRRETTPPLCRFCSAPPWSKSTPVAKNSHPHKSQKLIYKIKLLQIVQVIASNCYFILSDTFILSCSNI